VSPLTRNHSAAAREMVVRFQPNSSLIGMTKMPKAFRDPTVKKAMKKQVATTYHP